MTETRYEDGDTVITTDDVVRDLIDHVHFGGNVTASERARLWAEQYDDDHAPDDADDEPADKPKQTGNVPTKTTPPVKK